MYFLLGNSHMDRRDHEGAIQYFERARTQMRHHTSRTLFVVSLVGLLTAIIATHSNLCQISGWQFDGLGIRIQKCLCEALYAADRTKEAGESMLKMASTMNEGAYVNAPTTWESGRLYAICLFAIRLTFHADFLQRCLSAPESNRDATSRGHDDVPSPTPLLREWARLKLANGSWKEVLSAADSVGTHFLWYPSWA